VNTPNLLRNLIQPIKLPLTRDRESQQYHQDFRVAIRSGRMLLLPSDQADAYVHEKQIPGQRLRTADEVIEKRPD